MDKAPNILAQEVSEDDDFLDLDARVGREMMKKAQESWKNDGLGSSVESGRARCCWRYVSLCKVVAVLAWGSCFFGFSSEFGLVELPFGCQPSTDSASRSWRGGAQCAVSCSILCSKEFLVHGGCTQ